MVVLRLTQKYHELGWAIRRLMNAPNIMSSNQTEFADLIERESGYPIDQRTLSSYMRLVTLEEEETGARLQKPRTRAPESFVAALLRLPMITDEQRRDVIAGWVSIQLPERRDALREIFAAMSETGTSTEAWSEMLGFEADRANRVTGENSASSGGREKAV